MPGRLTSTAPGAGMNSPPGNLPKRDMEILTTLLLMLVYAMLIEYGVHRWAMHIPLFGKHKFWREHHIEHHAHHRFDVSIDLTPWQVLALFIPLMPAAFWFGWPLLVGMAVYSLIYSAAWTVVHRAMHNLGCAWVKRVPGYRAVERHHLLHHDHPTTNFAALWISTDLLFGTKRW